MRHEVHAYDYVNRPYEVVRAALLAAPRDLFERARVLHTHAGPFEVGAEIAIEVVSIQDVRSPDARPSATFEVAWKARHRPELFPTMHATLRVYALTPTETQLDLGGTYDPPLGAVGAALDAIALRGIAKETVENFVRDVARILRSELAAS